MIPTVPVASQVGAHLDSGGVAMFSRFDGALTYLCFLLLTAEREGLALAGAGWTGSGKWV